MAVALDLADIQGNILSAYGKLGFPKGRFMLLHVSDAAAGRKLINALLPRITTALRWRSPQSRIPEGSIEVPRPQVAINIAFSFYGLIALDIPTRTLRGMPDEFIDGMRERAPMLGDDFSGPDWESAWDEVWTAAPRGPARVSDPKTVHVLLTLNAQMNKDGSAVAALDDVTREIEALCEAIGGVRILPGHGGPEVKFQELSALTTRLANGTVLPSPKEHFGFRDAIGDPVFEGQLPGREEMHEEQGNGAVDGAGKWRPLKTGEFLLGHPDEAQEIAGAAMPLDFSRNGTFMAYRKLHQKVDKFRKFMTETAAHFGAVFGISDPADARETLMAKFAGRWSDGVPLAVAATADEWRSFNARFPQVSLLAGQTNREREQALLDFTYKEDPEGLKCPIASHIRRANTRDALAPTGTEGSVLNNRRRILRRGLPYGDSPEGAPDSSEHGIVMLVVCASLFRQFEFVQQQWINYGLDARSGNDTCPLIGNHSTVSGTAPKAKYVIPSDPKSGRPPFIVEGLPQFVEARGGEYFFVPSMTALRLIGMGIVDPT